VHALRAFPSDSERITPPSACIAKSGGCVFLSRSHFATLNFAPSTTHGAKPNVSRSRIAANTEAIQKLTAVLQSQQITPAADAPAAAPAPRASRTKKEDKTPAADTSGAQTGSPAADIDKAADALHSGVNDGKRTSMNLQPGDPEGTRYFHIPAHNTVAAVKPGEVIPSIPGIEEITGGTYADLKAKYASALVPSGNGASAAPATGAAATASPAVQPPSPVTSTTADSGVELTELCKKLHARDGNEGLLKFLNGQGAMRVGELAAKTDKHAVAIAALKALLNPTPAATGPVAGPDLF
jgi:hypothetical protein